MESPFARPAWAPRTVRSRGGMNGALCHFDMTAPITGDAIYKGQKDNVIVHALVPNPDAWEHQLSYFAALGRR
jgi:hypothetical protein